MKSLWPSECFIRFCCDWFSCAHDASLAMKTWAGFCWQLAEVSLFQGQCWSHIMLMMNLSSHHITHPSNYLPLYSALVWVIIRVLLIKPPLIFCVLITVWNVLRTELRSTELTGSPNLLHQREQQDGREQLSVQIWPHLHCYSRPPRKNFRALGG